MLTHRSYVNSYMEWVSGTIEERLAELPNTIICTKQLKDKDITAPYNPVSSVPDEWLNDSDFLFALAEEYAE